MSDPAADTIAHFRTGFEVMMRYPVMVLPPLAAQGVVFVLTIATSIGRQAKRSRRVSA